MTKKLTTYLIGIDDTDNHHTRGTGFRSRHLSTLINAEELGKANSVTRHQLYFHPDIPYTSQNSSACIEVVTTNVEDIKLFCQAYLKCECAQNSDVGLCIANINKVNDEVINWGIRAKKEILNKNEALNLAKKNDIFLKGLLGNLNGIIGALAAVGLRKSGNDGRFIWLSGKELREFSGIYSAKELYSLSFFDEIVAKDNSQIGFDDRININEWMRPVLHNSKITLIIDSVLNNKNYEWQIASKDYIKKISN